MNFASRGTLWLAPCLLASALAVPSLFAQVTAQQHAQRANEALRAGHPERAIPEFEALLALQPNNADVQANLGVLQYFQGDIVHGVAHMRAALQMNAKLPRIQALLGMGEAMLGQPDAAQQDLGAAMAGLAGDASQAKLRRDVGLRLVELDQARGELLHAAETLQTLREAAPNDAEILYASYRVSTDLAGESLLDLSLAAPKSGQMQQAIAHELLRIRDNAGALASFRKAIALDPKLPGIHFEYAEVLHASDSTADRTQAEAEYALAWQQNPAQAEAAVRLGDIHADRNDMAGAATFYAQALKVQPGNAGAALGMARVDSERGEDAKALPLLQGVVTADPSNMQAHFRLSALYRKLKRPDDAKRELAEYQRLKDLKESLRAVYASMRLASPGAPDAGTNAGAKK